MLSRLFLLAVLLPFALGCLPTKGKDDDVKATTVAAITLQLRRRSQSRSIRYQPKRPTATPTDASFPKPTGSINAENNRIKKDKDVKEEDRNRPNVMLTKNDCNQNPSVCDDVTEILIEYKRLDGWYPLSIDVILNDKPFTFTNPTPAADDLSCTAPNTVKNWLTGYPQCSSYIKEGWTQQQIDDDEKKVAWWVIGKNGVKHTLNKADSEKYLANNLERPHEPCPLK
ncbi:hypothetical protein L596_016501 [Steinernema carpocapsae]|uniref:Uncharacterized protein n=1 Tax=Steinernema carpocapsae TaxID=34508 RepID=A0A4V6A3E6_STECR|nr:hypothetical protein L596_016501 [Steinernema carpocapsae]